MLSLDPATFRTRYCNVIKRFFNWEEACENTLAWTATAGIIKTVDMSKLVYEFNKAFKIDMPRDIFKNANCSYHIKDIILRHCVEAFQKGSNRKFIKTLNLKGNRELSPIEAIGRGYTHITIYGDYIRLENLPSHPNQKPYDMYYVKSEL